MLSRWERQMKLAVVKDGAPQQYRCILWGGYAWGNIGDELTLAVALKDMRYRYGESIAILTRSPGYSRRQFPDCAIIPFDPVPQNPGCGDPVSYYDVEQQVASTSWAKQIAACEMLYLVGGGYLSDLFHLDWLLLPIFVARHKGVQIATGPIGLGPFTYDGWAKRVAESLQIAKVVVRDDASLKFCREYGIPAVQRDDDGFRLTEVLQLQQPERDRKSRPWRIGVNVFNQYGSNRHIESSAWWEALLKHLSHENTLIEGFCFHNLVFEDFAATSECLAKAGLDPCMARVPDFDFRVSCAQLVNFDAIVSSRFHAIVVGNVIGTRTYAVCDGEYYGHKMKAATSKFNRSTLVRQLDTSPEETAANILQALQSAATPQRQSVATVQPTPVAVLGGRTKIGDAA
jgi:polysaccharide pyruvyl transferase WcaK-like protein